MDMSSEILEALKLNLRLDTLRWELQNTPLKYCLAKLVIKQGHIS